MSYVFRYVPLISYNISSTIRELLDTEHARRMPASRHKFIGKSSRPIQPVREQGPTQYQPYHLLTQSTFQPHIPSLIGYFLNCVLNIDRGNVDLITCQVSFILNWSVFSALPPVDRSHLRFTCELTLTCCVMLVCQVHYIVCLLMTISIGRVVDVRIELLGVQRLIP